LAQLLTELVVLPAVALFQRHEAAHRLAGNLIRLAHHRRFRHHRMLHQRGLHLHRAQPMAADIHHVVDPPQNPVIAVVIAARGSLVKYAPDLAPILL
jgi:hypothetical protein